MGKEFKANTLEEMCNLMCDNRILENDGMTIEETIIIIGNLPVNGDECYDITQYQEAKAMAIQALGTLQKIIDLDTYDQPMDAWTGIEYVKRIVEEMFGEVGESE